MRILVVAETDGQHVSEKTLPAIAFAQRFGAEEFQVLAIGSNLHQVENLSLYGAQTVWTVEHPELAKPLADRYAAVIAHAARLLDAEVVVAATSTFSRDILARAAALLDIPMLSDIIGLNREEDQLWVKRPIYSANLIGTFGVEAPRFAVTVRGPAWGKPVESGSLSPIRSLNPPENLPKGSEWLSLSTGAQGRPDLTQARVVVSGGRPLKDPETFEKYIGAVADLLGGAVGATRAAVDAGIVPNELQVGQTGKTVAPELYIAIAISGSVQHLAGMKDSKVIVAINIDPEAPIFEVADYGLVADLYEVVPQLIEELKRTAPSEPANAYS